MNLFCILGNNVLNSMLSGLFHRIHILSSGLSKDWWLLKLERYSGPSTMLIIFPDYDKMMNAASFEYFNIPNPKLY